MARPFYLTITASGTSVPYVADTMQSPFGVRWAVEVPNGVTVSYSIEFTLDDVNDSTWTPVWFTDPNAGTGQTTSMTGTYSEPVRGIRVNAASLSGGNIRFAVLQGMSSR